MKLATQFQARDEADWKLNFALFSNSRCMNPLIFHQAICKLLGSLGSLGLVSQQVLEKKKKKKNQNSNYLYSV